MRSLHLWAEGGPQGGLGKPTRLDISSELEATKTALCTDGGQRAAQAQDPTPGALGHLGPA